MDEEMETRIEDENLSDESVEDMDTESENENIEEDDDSKKDVYLPHKPIRDGEILECDPSAYVMLHDVQSKAPCLSFDIIRDKLGDNRDKFPFTAYMAVGTQATKLKDNAVIVMKLYNMYEGVNNEESDDNGEDSDNEPTSSEDEINDSDKAKDKNPTEGGSVQKTKKVSPKMSALMIPHASAINRIRSTTINDGIFAAVWSERKTVDIYNVSDQFDSINSQNTIDEYNQRTKKGSTVKPIYTFAGHSKEGFGLDWCATRVGMLATGDCHKSIHIWNPTESGWKVDKKPLIGHTASVEDLQWSPNERCVLASCSMDRTIRIWDTRAPQNRACMIQCTDAHDSDINVISWNHNEPFLVSGGDEGHLKIWDVRRLHKNTEVAVFKHHRQPVTTVEWHPTDAGVFASGGGDDQIAQWDLSVEKDSQTGVVGQDASSSNNEQIINETDEIEGIPPQLLFIHQGQTDIKELHWHPQSPGLLISTAFSGFNIFKTISV